MGIFAVASVTGVSSSGSIGDVLIPVSPNGVVAIGEVGGVLIWNDEKQSGVNVFTDINEGAAETWTDITEGSTTWTDVAA